MITLLLYIGIMVMLAPLVVMMANNGADRHPQYISFEVVESALNTYTQIQIPLPLGLVGGAQSHMAVEITSVWWDNSQPDLVPDTLTRVEAHIATQSRTAIGSLNNPDIIDKITTSKETGAAATGAELEVIRPVGHDLMAGEFGPLTAAQTLFAAVKSVGNLATKGARGRIYYRLVKVNVTELLGLAAQLTQAAGS